MQNPAAEQVTKALKDANNVLVTVRNSPSVDELSAAIALTLMLNHMNKHAITVFSGRVPSTLEFLQPEMAIDTNTDSLRDFIIALDKSKADKLRYKVEDSVDRIFITPYKTSVTEHDLEFSQGDFNVDVVVALGVVNKEDFDQAVTTHGRILHDANVVTLTKGDAVSQLGAVNWQEPQASSLSEMITSIVDGLGENVLDGQIATALLTGIVAETDRFRNASTTPQVMSLSSKLMAAGANQQLVAEKLEEPDMGPEMAPIQDSASAGDGALEIDHDDGEDVGKIHIDDSGNLKVPDEIEDEAPKQPEEATLPGQREYIDTPTPTLFGQDDSGTTSAQPLFGDKPGSQPEISSQFNDDAEPANHEEKIIQPLAESDAPGPESIAPPAEVVEAPMQALEPPASVTPPELEIPPQPQDSLPTLEEPVAPQATPDSQTLTDIEKAVGSEHVQSQDVAQPQAAPNVEDFLGTTRATPDPVAEPEVAQENPVTETPAEEKKQEEAPAVEIPAPEPAPQVINPTDPPAVPPPLMPQSSAQPQFYEADGTNSNPFLNPGQ